MTRNYNGSIFIREPENSWEISYVINWKRPEIKLDVTIRDLIKYIPEARRTQLRTWANNMFDSRWLREHITHKVYTTKGLVAQRK